MFNGTKLCECGCREEIPLISYGVKLRYKKGHNHKGKFKENSLRMKILQSGMKMCECGRCNELISVINKQGKVTKFKHGHSMKGKRNFSNWRGGRYINSEKYVMIYDPNHPRAYRNSGYISEHRLVMEQYLKRYLTDDEVVHH